MTPARALPLFSLILLVAACPAHREAPDERPPLPEGATRPVPPPPSDSTTDAPVAPPVPGPAAAPTPGETEDEPQPAEPSAPSPTEPAEEAVATDVFHVFDNGVRCVTWPCANWTLREVDGDAELTVAEIDLSALGLTGEEQEARMRELAEGRWTVRGRVEPGAKGPAGVGRVLRVEALVAENEPPVRE